MTRHIQEFKGVNNDGWETHQIFVRDDDYFYLARVRTRTKSIHISVGEIIPITFLEPKKTQIEVRIKF